MPDRRGDPLAGVDRLLVDGTNVLHQLARSGAAPPAAAIGRIRAAIPGTIRIELVFDGPADQGGAVGRVAQGMTVRYAGRHSADDILREAVEAAALADPASASRIVIVTDDHALRRVLERSGARTLPARWLIGRFDRTVLAAPAAGNQRAPRAPAGPSDDDPDVARWRPGRGATAKCGNPRRLPRRRPGVR
jgi:hypothetical protein